jgi:putative tryptophan/tyrosine transport system substrate-binding protein
MSRREFITLLGGAAAWPLAARAQQPQRMRRVGVLMDYAENEPEAQSFVTAFVTGLQELGWTEGHNLEIEYRWAEGNVDRMASFARELVALRPDAILANTTPVIAALHRETRTIPIVFAIVSDPVGDGFVASLARPGGNITGFITLEASVGGKWIELLKEVAPSVTRAALMFNPDTAPGRGAYFQPTFESGARTLGVKSILVPVSSDAEIEKAVAAIVDEPIAGLVVMTDGFMRVHRGTVIAAAARYRIPAVYPLRTQAQDGGLLSYGPYNLDLFGRSAGYVDRILRGTSPADLPVQVPTKFQLVINLKTAKALGLTVSPTLLARADEVIE